MGATVSEVASQVYRIVKRNVIKGNMVTSLLFKISVDFKHEKIRKHMSDSKEGTI